MTRFTRALAIFGGGLVIMLAVLVGFHLARPVPATGGAEASKAAIGGPFQLVDAAGKTVTDKSYRGKYLLIYFGYTHCPDACPTTLGEIATALQRLGPAAAKLQPLFISVDPRRDTPDIMGEYAKSFDPRIVGLTGSETEVSDAARRYGVYVQIHKVAGSEDYLVDHSSYLYVMAPDGSFVTALGSTMTGEQLADRLKPILDRNA